jgi:hypothetical protein
MVTFFELKKGIPDDIYSVWCTGHYLMQKDAAANGARRKSFCNIAKGKEQSSMGLLEVKGDCG